MKTKLADKDERIKELEAENEQQRDYINYVDDCYFLWSKKQVHVQPHFYSGWLVDRPMFVAILEEAKESSDED